MPSTEARGPAPDSRLLHGLNPAQRAAVEHREGPLLVLAGAGSGKTRVITHRIARLIERGTRPEAILAVSFTNKAAAEMRERMVPLVGKKRAQELWLSTFHSFGVRFLREERRTLESLGFGGRFVIFDQGDCLGTLREVLKREGLAERDLDVPALLTRISLWKNAFLDPKKEKQFSFEYDEVAWSAYPGYEAALRNMHAVDFDDLVVLPARLLGEHEELRRRWQQRFRYILVDEFQDTNAAQLELVRRLANELGSVCVVGDDDQSIYGWRGAEVGNILDFERHFKGTRIVKLEQNYRSVSPILDVANAAIKASKGKRHDKTLSAARGKGPKVRFSPMPDEEAEARFVVSEVKALMEKGRRAKDFAVLYRSNLQARPIEEELRLAGIPYRLYGGTQLFEKKEVKDAIAYLRAAVYPSDEISLRRILNTPARGIGNTSIERLQRFALVHGIPFHQALRQAEEMPDLPGPAKVGIRSLIGLLDRARSRLREAQQSGRGLTEATKLLLKESGLMRMLAEDKPERAKKRRANVVHVVASIDRYEKMPGAGKPSLDVFLSRMTMRFDQEEEAQGDRLTLCSLHSSKGLEFPVVFFIGLNEGRIPHTRTTDPKATEAAPTDVEEERRLFYVGVTRARDRLYLCRPKARLVRGRVKPLVPTRFLEGLPEEAIEHYEPFIAAPLEGEESASMGRALLDKLRGGG